MVRDGLKRYEGVLDHIVLYSPSIGLSSERVQQNLHSLIRECAPPVSSSNVKRGDHD
jgi:hypothetical protein